MLKEFKEFIMRGNVIDMAVGIVIGGAFTAIVTSLVEDIIMPLLGLVTAGIDFKSLGVVLSTGPDGEPNILAYGNLINTIITFLLISLCVFFVIKGINKMRALATKQKEEEKEEEAEETELDLLRDILATLKNQEK
ncbi:MAG TPA: large-conductance mechanosensitive channel protein MscL [Clostridiaceae bacterium]|nr:large-conductance mechanosensitive channel protein MscL [Clostridiaceae bacterium]